MLLLKGQVFVALLCVATGLPAGQDVPPRAKRVSDIEIGHIAVQSAKALSPPPTQMLVQQTQNYVDADGDEHISTQPHPPRGVMGSTDHLKDDQFFLNIPFSEVQFDAVVDVTWVRPAAQMSKLDYIGLYEEGDADDAIPCNWEFAPGEGPTGTVKLQLTNHGKMEIRYFDVAADRPRVRLPILVHPPCANNCSNHGICEKGQCVCFAPYKGEECCEVGGKIAFTLNTTTATVGSILHVQLTPPAGSLDKRNWIGVFRAGSPAPELNLMQQAESVDIRHQLIQVALPATLPAQTVELDSNVELLNITATPPLIWRYVNDTLDIPLPYIAGEYVLKVVKNIDGHPVLGTSDVIYVHGVCPNGCSGHGTCVNGTCVCDEGYTQTLDCSLGDGLVRLSVTPTECLVGSIITVTWERNSDGGFSNLDYLALFDESDTTFDAPFAYQFAQPEEQQVAPKLQEPLPPVPGVKPVEPKVVDRGVVEFNAPTAKAKFVVRYFRRDHFLFAVSSPIEVYFDCLVKDCSGHGDCIKGECHCSSGWKGSDCSTGEGPIVVSCSTEPRVINSAINVTWSRPEKIGSIYDFVALYSHGAANDQPYMYRYANNEGENSGTVTLQLPSQPGLYEVRYIDAFSRETIAGTNTIEAHLPCPNACSGHGTCQKDVCLCNTDWTARDDCSAKIGVTQISAVPLTLETPSDTKITVTFKRPEGSGSPQDFIGLFPKSQTNNRHPIDFVVPTTDFGTLTFSAPHYDGIYQIRYIAGAQSESKAHSLDIDVTKACLNKCSEHGVCNRGTCQCVNGWGGTDCSVGQGPTSVTVGPHLGNPGDKLLITYTRPVNNGGPSDLLAIYYKDKTDLTTPLGFVMASEKDTDTVETKMPAVEADLVVHYIRGSDQKSLGQSSPFKVVFPCKEDCNNHGSCKLGFCTCNDGWDGFSCGTSVPTAFEVSVSSNTVDVLGTIEASWKAIPKKSTPSDYLGIYAVSDVSSTAPFVYEYVSMRATGKANLMAPQQAGQYVVRFIGNFQGFSQSLAESEVINVVVPPKACPDNCNAHGTCDTATGNCACGAGWSGNNCALKVPTEWAVSTDAVEYEPSFSIQCTWARPLQNTGNHLDNIGIYAQGSDKVIQYQYVGVGHEGVLTLQSPTPKTDRQKYVLKFMNGATGQPMATSAPFEVIKKATPLRNMKKSGKRVHHLQ
eukprot:c5540_g1_i1.p1 GENE.c5540_g1_i1~~c5540_g1_i1.p1  ORF type:complete len:1184 (-),score=227.24 c5540_g1_i1:48-3599(-)